jgi:hypothetical protein
MKRATFVVSLLVSVGALVGCGDTAATSNSASGSSSPVASNTAKPLADSDLPVAADYEEEAEKQITPATYKTELESLEKEVDSNN